MSDTAGTPRSPIPADLRRQVLVEAGHRCAIPTCRYIEVEVHHIVPWATCQEHRYDNLIALCPNCHDRADRGAIDRKSLRLYKLNLRFAHDKFSQLEIDVLFEANARQVDQAMDWPPYLRILLKRIVDAGLVELHDGDDDGFLFVNGKRMDLAHLFITDKGRDFIAAMGEREL